MATKIAEFMFENIIEHSLTVIVTIFTPLLTKELLIPFLMHPFRLGGMPFKAPSPIGYMILYLIVSCSLVASAVMISASMSSTKKCGKISIKKAILSTKWTSFFLIFGFTILFLVPILKLPLLVLFAAVPYSNQLVNGLMLTPFVFMGHFIGSRIYMDQVC